MKVHVQSVNFNVDRKLVSFIEDKVNNLEKYYDRIIGSDVYLKVENTSEKENKIAEVKLNIPGGELMVKKQCRTFEECVDLAADSLRRQLNKRKEKQRAHHL